MRRSIVAKLIAFIALLSTAHASDYLDCRSSNYRYTYCRADTNNNVRLSRQLSGSSCDYGRSWGYDKRGIWVDNGCAASFEYGSRGRGGRSDDTGKVMAGVAAIAILGAIIASNNSNDSKHRHDDGRVPNWAIGSFSGYDSRQRVGIQLNIDGSGRIEGYAQNRFEGQFDGDRAYLDNRGYSVMALNNGFRLTADDDRYDSIDFYHR
jgi:Protein of unknown function (DUF3011)